MKATVDALSLARILRGLKLGDAKPALKKGQKKEDVVTVTICAQNNRLRVQLETFDTVLTAWNSATRRFDGEAARYTVTAELYAKVTEEGAYRLSFAAASRIAKFCTGGDIELCARGARMELTQARRKYAVVVQQGEMVGFPEIAPGVIVPRDALRGVVVSHSAPDDTHSCLYQWAAVEPAQTGTTVSWTDGVQMFWQTLDPDLPGDRILVPLFAIKCLEALKSNEEAADCTATGIRCGGCCVTYLEQRPSYPHTMSIIQQASCVSEYTEVRTTCEDLRTMLKQLSSCMHDEIILSATDSRLRMLAYDNRGEHTRAANTCWGACPRAEAWIDAVIDRPFGAVGLNAARLKRALGSYSGAITLRVSDGDSPVFVDIENSGIRTVLMPLSPSFNRTTID